MRAEVMPKPELPGHAVLRVHELSAAPHGLTICIERRQGPEKYLADSGWQRSESWLAPERIEAFGGGIDFHVGPVVCDMVAGLTVRLSIREPGVGNVGATVVPWPTMQTSGAYDPNRMVTGDMPQGTDRGFATGSAPTTVVRLREAPEEPPLTQVQVPQPFVPDPLPQQFQPQPEVPPVFPVQQQDQVPPPFPVAGQEQGAPPFPYGGQQPIFGQPPETVVGQRFPPFDQSMDQFGEEKPKKSSAGIWIAVAVASVLLLIGAGGAAYWWFEPCGFCQLTKMVGLEICGRCKIDTPPEEPEIPERVLADRFLKTGPTPAAMVEQCRTFRRQNKKVAAFLVCKVAADKEDPLGALETATYYDPLQRDANSPVYPDAEMAVHYYRIATTGDLVVAMRRLGELYFKGPDNVPADKAKACEWLGKAADKGDADSKNLLTEYRC